MTEMLTLIEDLPEGVVGVEAHGKVTSEDYERVLAPAVEAATAESGAGKVRLLYVLGLGHLRSWERIAIVGDADWLRHAVHGLGWLMPGEIRVFGLEELDSAREWVASMLPDQERIF